MGILARLRAVNRHNLATLRQQPLAELSGSLGDLGTLLPLMLALTVSNSISLPSTLVFTGLANILTGLTFGIPLPVQPMKAVASIAIANSYSQAETVSAGLFVAGAVAFFSVTGLLRYFTRAVPIPVVRGIQVGAGLSLVISAGTSLLSKLTWVSPTWADNRLWAIFAFLALLASSRTRRVPYALLITALGLIFAAIQLSTSSSSPHPSSGPWLWHPHIVIPTPQAFSTGAIQAGIPQLPLTTLNSILAVTSLAHSLPDLHRDTSLISTTTLGLSVAAMNAVSPWFGAMPVCHGSGGLAAQYRFGARSGASVVLLGVVKLLLGLLAGERVAPLLARFPVALLGIMVLAAGVELAKVGRDLGGQNVLWEEASAVDGEGEAVKVGEVELERRWAVLLVTVAGCLAFKNDAVGFIAGMVWHWGMEAERRWRARKGLGGERRPLLSQ